MICKKCNSLLPDDSEFCQYCGSKVNRCVRQSISSNKVFLLDKIPDFIIIALSIGAVILNFITIFTQDIKRGSYEDISPSLLYGIHILLSSLLIVLTILKNRNISSKIQLVLRIGISILSLCDVLIMSTEYVWSERFFYVSAEEVKFCNIVIVVLDVITLIISTCYYIEYLFKKMISCRYNSIGYKERCYKKVENMYKYYKNGIISEEEYEIAKREILRHISK